MSGSSPLLESRLTAGIYFAPIVLAGGAAALLVAWLVLSFVGGDPPPLLGPLMAIAGTISLLLAGLWTWGARRARLVIGPDELTMTPHLGSVRSVRLANLASVDFRRLPGGSAARALYVTDAEGQSVQIGVGAWEREDQILSLIGEAARRSGAEVSPEAEQAIRRGFYDESTA